MSPAAASSRPPRHPNAGWLAAGLIILAVLATGAALWFRFHP